MDHQGLARPWQLGDGIGSLAARARIAGTARLSDDGLAHSGGPIGSCLDMPLIGPGTLLVAAYVDAALHGGGVR